MLNFNLNIQTHLFIGSNIELKKKAIKLLQQNFCNNNECGNCHSCIQISSRIHEKLIWLSPEKQYNLDQIDIVMQNISLSLDNENKFFIIFDQADLLTVACSNRLLKSIEEPPKGYYFIFLTERPQSILPTILSRCVTTHFDNPNNDLLSVSNELETSDIGKFFITTNTDPLEFLKIVDKTTINEFESIELVDKLINFWSRKCKNSIVNNNEIECKKIEHKLKILNLAFQYPPMPGSNKIFWKNLFLNFIS